MNVTYFLERKITMKKKIASLLTAVLAVGMLTACGSSDADKALKDMDVEKYVTLGEYKGLNVTVAPITVDEAQVDSLVDSAYSTYISAENGGITDRAVAVGDTANIDYVGKKDDVAFDGGTAQGYNLTIGSNSFIDGFEDGLVGVMPGETVDLELSFPEQYHSADLAGQAVIFTVTVNFIVPEEKSDDVVMAMGIEDVTTVEQLRQYAYDYLYSMAQTNYNASLGNSILYGFMESCIFEEIPQEIVDMYYNQGVQKIAQQAANYGMLPESFVPAYFGMEYDAFLAEFGEEAAKQNIAMQAVANAENLNVTDEELNAKLLEYAQMAGFNSVEEFLGDESIEMYRDNMMYEKVMAFLTENAVISNE